MPDNTTDTPQKSEKKRRRGRVAGVGRFPGAKGNRGGGAVALKYRPHFAERAKDAAMYGMTDIQIAEQIFRVTPPTLYNWIKRYPNFAKAIHDGREPANAKVSRAVFDSAVGCTIEDVQILMGRDGKPIEHRYKRKLPPSIPASKLWLTVKGREKGWQEKTTTEHTGPGGAALAPSVVIHVSEERVTHKVLEVAAKEPQLIEEPLPAPEPPAIVVQEEKGVGNSGLYAMAAMLGKKE